jgi:hypothetical protein
LDGLFDNKKHYMRVVKDNRHVVDYGDNKYAPTGWWIEKNLQPWYNLFTMPQKTLKYDLKHFMKTLKANTPEQPANDEINVDLS